MLARVAKAEHRVEQCLQRGKSEAGLAEYQVRTWSGWYHHQALSLIAAWFLVKESSRGKKVTPALTVPQVRELIASRLAEVLGHHQREATSRRVTRWLQACLPGRWRCCRHSCSSSAWLRTTRKLRNKRFHRIFARAYERIRSLSLSR